MKKLISEFGWAAVILLIAACIILAIIAGLLAMEVQASREVKQAVEKQNKLLIKQQASLKEVADLLKAEQERHASGHVATPTATFMLNPKKTVMPSADAVKKNDPVRRASEKMMKELGYGEMEDKPAIDWSTVDPKIREQLEKDMERLRGDTKDMSE